MDQVVPQMVQQEEAEELNPSLWSWLRTRERRLELLQVVPNWTGEEIEIVDSEQESEIFFWQNRSD